MAIEIIDERFENISKSLQELIILILTKEYPLTTGTIAKRLRSEFKIKMKLPRLNV